MDAERWSLSEVEMSRSTTRNLMQIGVFVSVALSVIVDDKFPNNHYLSCPNQTSER